MNETHAEPSPTAAATRFMLPERTSPTACPYGDRKVDESFKEKQGCLAPTGSGHHVLVAVCSSTVIRLLMTAPRC